MKKFARIFEIDNVQSLFFTEFDNENNVTLLNQIIDFGDIRGNLKMGFQGDKQTEESDQYLADIDEEYVIMVMADMRKEMDELPTMQ
jgi:hypothetical protein